MTYWVMICGFLLAGLFGWLGWRFASIGCLMIGAMALLEIIITDGVAAGIKKAKEAGDL